MGRVTVRPIGSPWLRRAAGALGLEFDRRATALSLRGPKYDDAAVEHLVALRSLERLELANTRISDAAVDRLRRALPGCRVERSGS